MLTSSEYVSRLREILVTAHHLAQVHLGTAQLRQEYYDKKAHGTPIQPGEQVRLNSPTPVAGVPTKFKREWAGSYIIVENVSPSTCRIAKICANPGDRCITVHFNLKAAFSMKTDPFSGEDSGIDLLPGGRLSDPE
ncbi:unnamed protein product [Echinostoma caproni]|uniref:Complex I-B14.5a n=1 Tax=Echinostoma caproni TaxID=27848 RepID=A0A183AJP5_9TREM|nr:unnamed protein product [Echinostoma caproni]